MQIISFKTALNPTEKQAQAFSSHLGAVRFAYNWGVNHILENWEAHEKDPSVPYISTSAYSIRNDLNAVKDAIAPWHKENSKEAFACGAANVSKAFENWFQSRNGKHKGSKAGFPRFKTRHDDLQAGIIFTVDPKRLEIDNKHFTLPKIGTVRLYERLTKVRSLLNQGGTIGNVTVTYSQGKWWISILIRVEDTVATRYFNQQHKRKASSTVGLDVGLKVFLTDSKGKTIENPKFLRKSLAKIRKANKRLSRRKGFDKKTGEIASNRYKKTHQQVIKANAQVTNQRKDFIHKLTTELVLNNIVIGLEDLNVAGMMKNKHLSLSIADAGWGEFKRQCKYKGLRYGSAVIEVGRFFASSKTCSRCGVAKAKLLLSERTFHCDSCGLSIDRDENAAINIKVEALRLYNVAQSCGETLNERGGESSDLKLAIASSETIPDETLSSRKTTTLK